MTNRTAGRILTTCGTDRSKPRIVIRSSRPEKDNPMKKAFAAVAGVLAVFAFAAPVFASQQKGTKQLPVASPKVECKTTIDPMTDVAYQDCSVDGKTLLTFLMVGCDNSHQQIKVIGTQFLSSNNEDITVELRFDSEPPTHDFSFQAWNGDMAFANDWAAQQIVPKLLSANALTVRTYSFDRNTEVLQFDLNTPGFKAGLRKMSCIQGFIDTNSKQGN